MFGKKETVVVVPGPERTCTEYITKEVHEHRAPTDASVKLLREMEQAAIDKVEQSINVGGNGFECVINIHRESMSMDTVAVAIFKLNGKSLRATARVEGWRQQDMVALPDKLRDAVAKEIAAQVIQDALVAAWPKT